MKRSFIFGAGEETEITVFPAENDLVIAADGGEEYAKRSGITPTLFIGDLDSLEGRPETENKIILPAEKDDTDTMFAIKHALECGVSEIFIYGGTGKRLDHTLANIASAAYCADKGALAFLFGKGYVLTVIKNGGLSFDKGFIGTVSVFPHGKTASGVTLKGLKYGLFDAKITPEFPIGVSNEFTGGNAEITVKNGYLTVIWEQNGKNLPRKI